MPSNRAALARLVALTALSFTSACGSGGGSDVCREAADLCGAGQGFDADDCEGAALALAQCLVNRGDCEPLTAAECAGGGTGQDGGLRDDAASGDGADDGDGDDGDDGDGDGDGPAIQLRVSEVEVSESVLQVTVVLENSGEAEPLPVEPSLFRVVDADQTADVALVGTCDGGAFLYEGGRESCVLEFSWTAERAASEIVWAEPGGRTVSATVGGECAVRVESTPAACSDQCSNDGDPFVNCEDFDCCDVVNCPADTACGAVCVLGPEDTVATCTDECSNDGDTFIDCEDFDCCGVVVCPPESACGALSGGGR